MFKGCEFRGLFEFGKIFPDEESCIRHMEHMRWGENVISPFDPSSKVYKLSGHRYKCRNTNKYFNVRTGTFTGGSKIPLKQWFLAIYLLTEHKKGISSYQLARDLAVTQKTAWFMLQRIRYGMEHEAFLQPMEGNVQADDCFVGGKQRNRHHDKKVPQSQGRSFKDKTPVLGMLQTAKTEIVERPHKIISDKTVKEKVITQSAVVRCQAIPNTKAKVIRPILLANIKQGSNLITDEWQGYNGLDGYFTRQVVNHKRKEYKNEAGWSSNGVENVWSHFKRAWISTYSGRITPRHLNRYLTEYSFRYNTKDLSASERFNLLLQGAGGKRLKYKTLIQQC